MKKGLLKTTDQKVYGSTPYGRIFFRKGPPAEIAEAPGHILFLHSAALNYRGDRCGL